VFIVVGGNAFPITMSKATNHAYISGSVTVPSAVIDNVPATMWREKTMKRHIVGGLAAVLMTAGLIAAAPPASAGCQYGGLVISKCDGPVQPDGSWQRCATFPRTTSGQSSYLPDTNCQTLGPDQHPWGLAFVDPQTHIDP
jgi:hypothetical protein